MSSGLGGRARAGYVRIQGETYGETSAKWIQVDLSRSKWHIDLIELNPDHAGIVIVEVSGSDFQPVKLPWFQGEGMKFADRIM